MKAVTSPALRSQSTEVRHCSGLRTIWSRRRRDWSGFWSAFIAIWIGATSGDSAIGFSGMEMETLVRYNFPCKIVVLNNGGIGPGMPEIPENPMFNMKPNSLIYGARYDRMMEAFGGKSFFVEDPKHIRGALDEAMNHRGPALVNVVISQGAARKPQQFRWHS
jgi:2-hydroxyacyl-CoA lyase 1